MKNHFIASKDFSHKTLSQLNKQGVFIIGSTIIPGSGPLPYANGTVGYEVCDGDTSKIFTHSQVLARAEEDTEDEIEPGPAETTETRQAAEKATKKSGRKPKAKTAEANQVEKYTIILPPVPASYHAAWHPVTGEENLTRGIFDTEERAIEWARSNLDGMPYQITTIDFWG